MTVYTLMLNRHGDHADPLGAWADRDDALVYVREWATADTATCVRPDRVTIYLIEWDGPSVVSVTETVRSRSTLEWSEWIESDYVDSIEWLWDARR